MVLYMPTLALVNSVSFNQMKDTAVEFPLIRTFGTIGWIISGLVISYVFGWDAQESIVSGALSNTFKMVALASLVLGIFSFKLPKTPPFREARKSFSLKSALGWDALKLLKERNFLLFFIFFCFSKNTKKTVFFFMKMSKIMFYPHTKEQYFDI